MSRIVRIIEPLDTSRYTSADARIRQFRFGRIDWGKSRYALLDAESVEGALSRHIGDDDWPVPSKHAFGELYALLESGQTLVQYELVCDDDETTTPARSSGLWSRPTWSSVRALLGEALLVRSATFVAAAIGDGELSTIFSRRAGRVDSFVLLDERFDVWAAQHERWVPGHAVRTNRWFTRDDLLVAVLANEVEGEGMAIEDGAQLVLFRHPVAVGRVLISADYARWVARQQPEAELERIRRHQVAAIS